MMCRKIKFRYTYEAVNLELEICGHVLLGSIFVGYGPGVLSGVVELERSGFPFNIMMDADLGFYGLDT